MSKDLQVAGALIVLILGLGLVKGQTRRELQQVGKWISVGSSLLLIYHTASRLS